jgi:cytochrome bd-type quinol oxidase subunit 2
MSAAPHGYYPPSPAVAQPHPLFPSVGHAPVPVAPAFPPAASPHGYYPPRRTNGWCAWGFGLGLTGFVLSIFCLGIFFAVPALLVSVIGFAKVQRQREQSGRGLAIAGVVLAVLAILISLGMGALLYPYLKNHEWSVTEQSSTNSE